MFEAYEVNNHEIHMFIIWSEGINYKDKIIASIADIFFINQVFEVNWSKELFSENLMRFYGQNLPRNSNKEKSCGTGTFFAIIVTDTKPIYAPRKTTKGVCLVNINMFDLKEKIRNGLGKNIIHATNNVNEANHDITLLLGVSPIDLIKMDFKLPKGEQVGDLVGARGWRDISQMLYVLNNTCKYVILRNFENYPQEIAYGIHSDIDILCNDYKGVQKILNGKSTSIFPRRVQHIVNVGNNFVNVDIRYVGDNYYDKMWEEKILSSRIYHLNGFYIPNSQEYLYSLMYHALIQKKNVARDYIMKIDCLCNDLKIEKINMTDQQNAIKRLNDFMEKNKYSYVEPVDYSVGYYYRRINKSAGMYRRIRFLISDLKYFILKNNR